MDWLTGSIYERPHIQALGSFGWERPGIRYHALEAHNHRHNGMNLQVATSFGVADTNGKLKGYLGRG